MTKLRSLKRLLAGLLIMSAMPCNTPAQTWDVTKPRGQTREIDFTTNEGTWMSVDLSHDGQWIVFDLLAHIYRVPAKGGQAESLTQNSGIAVNYHPRFSPDGKLIAFISDRGGQNNLWIMNADGSSPKPVFTDLSVCVSEPSWTADGSAIVVRRQSALGGCHRGNAASVGLWKYALDGSSPVELVGRNQPGAGWPFASPDGKYLYFHYLVCPAYPAGRNDLLKGCVQIRKLDLQTKQVTDVTRGEIYSSQWNRGSNGGAIAPVPSPDGRWLAFARRIPDGTISYKGHKYGPRNALWLRDLHTGAERILMDPIETDLAHGFPYAMHLLPTYSWARDSRSIVISQGGKIRRVYLEDGRVETIPFTARVRRTISQMAYAPLSISDGPFEARFLRWMTAAPDGLKAVFQAAGKLWISGPPSSTPRRLTPSSFAQLELSPAWSPDGRWIAFTTWDGKERGHVWKVSAEGGEPQRLTREAGEYVNPVWSLDGKQIIVTRGDGATARGHFWAEIQRFELVRLPGTGGDVTPVITVNDDGRGQIVRASLDLEHRVYFVESVRGAGGGVQLKSVKLDGSDPRIHTGFQFADEIAVSPDGKWVAFTESDNVYLMRLPQSAAADPPPRVDKSNPGSGVKQLSLEGGLFPHWVNAEILEFTSGNRYFTHEVNSGKTDSTVVRLTVPRPTPKGKLAFTGARILTMDNRRVIESGTIVVTGSRISCVGKCDTSGADRIINARGKTIIPGLIDTHAHHHTFHRGIIPFRNFETAIYLAYGVTTTIDPAAWSQNVFPEAEAIEAGFAIGPRTFSTGDVFHAGSGPQHNDLTSYEVAEREVNRRASWGAISLKDFLEPRREQRQWITEAARKRGVMVTGEGGSLEHDLSMVMDGQTGWEHDLTYVPIYSDAAKFFGQSKAVYSITLMTDGPGPLNEEYFWQASDVWKDPKQRSWLPWWWLVPHTRTRLLRPFTDYTFPILAQGLADIVAEGGYGGMGAHGDQHGLGSHWEIEMLASALGPMGALEVSTLHGAHFIGASKDLGSITVGKLADLVVLNSNPLDRIRNTADIKYVMKAGVLYDAATLDQLWPEQKPFGEHYWLHPGASTMDDRSTDYWDRPR
ncbi:MAG TPA: amidohydrolase family protein [Pyrinomonadaceae bacterium]